MCLASLLIALNLFIFSLPYIGFGFWTQSESPAGILNVCGVMAALGAVFITLFDREGTQNSFFSILLHPYVFFPALIGFCSLIMTVFVRIPVLSLVGSTRTGEGIGWWFAWASLTFASIVLIRIGWARRTTIAIASGDQVKA